MLYIYTCMYLIHTYFIPRIQFEVGIFTVNSHFDPDVFFSVFFITHAIKPPQC